MASADIVIAGAGIIGLSTALDLAQRGFRVQVFERGRAMKEASWAAAGMLAAEDPENPEALLPLARLSRSLYPEYLARVERLSGLSVPVRTRCALQATRPGGRFHCASTPSRRPLGPDQARRRIPSLAAADRSFLLLEELSIDPRDLCRALPAAALKAGVVLRENTEVQSVAAASATVEVATSAGAVSAGAFIDCCGAWSCGSLSGGDWSSQPVPFGDRPFDCPEGTPQAQHGAARSERLAEPLLESLVEPRKGQMLVVRLPEPAALAYVLRTPDVYLVPRGDGRVVVGATVERAGFDRTVERGALDRLREKAAEIWPPIAAAVEVENWAGLRPGTADELPFLGPAGAPNCWLAAGHFRNGILLAPATASVMTRMIAQERPEIPLEAFSLRRAVTSAGGALRSA